MITERITPDYRTVFEQFPVGVVIYDRGLHVVGCNERFATMVKASREQIIGLHIDDLRDQRHRSALLMALAGATVTYESPYQATLSDVWLWVRATFGPLRDPAGAIVGAIVMASTDDASSDGAPSARALPSAATQLGEAERFGHLGSWTWDAKRLVTAGSPEFFRILGLKSDQTAPLETYASLIHPEDRSQCLAQLTQVIELRLPESTHEFRIVRPDGTMRWVALRMQGMFDADGQLLSAWGLVQDVTERQLLEAQLRQAQKMEAMGQLAAGVAHDFNNLLTVIKVESDILATDGAALKGMQDTVRSIRTAADRATDLTKQLLAFSRKQLLRPQLLDVNDVVAGSIQMLRRLIGADVELLTDLAPQLPPIFADPGQLTQVLVNLTVNARDAMPTGGTLSITTGMEFVGERNEHNRPAGDYVVIVVADTGHGMNEATRQRIFEPFFTTKAPGQGTGLGLATVYGIIEQLSGDITVTSVPDKGTTFTMYFLPQPLEPPSARDSPPRSSARSAPSTAATILLVEDEPAVRFVCQRVLEREGHRVLSAGDAGEAIRLAEASADRIDLLLTDLVLPSLNGRDLYESLLRTHDELRVLYMSGYSDDEMVRRGLIDVSTRVLEKPIAVTELLAAVKEALT